MLINDIITRASHIGEPESPEGRMERFSYILDEMLPFVSGNLCEIGGGSGLTTRIMLEAAKKYNRKVLVIDPFEDEWNTMPNGYGGYPFQAFTDNTIGYRDQLVLCRNNSLSSYAMDAIKNLDTIAFVFLDGLQFDINVLQELAIMSYQKSAVICVDDINRSTNISQVPRAVNTFLHSNYDYKLVKTKPLIEGYLINKA